MHTASSRATFDILLELLDKGYARVTNLRGDYSDDAARSVLHAMEDEEVVTRVRANAHTYYMGYTLTERLSSIGVKPRNSIYPIDPDMTYEEYEKALLEVSGDVQ
jgi:DNA-binding HxlR family transcriptional regulator